MDLQLELGFEHEDIGEGAKHKKEGHKKWK